MTTRDFKFSVNLLQPGGRAETVAKAREAEALGYDAILVADHLNMPAPFTTLMLVAEVTERPRLGTFVLNAGFYNPTLLAREVAGLDQLTDGRLDVGLGAGYVQEEFDRAGIPFGTPRDRVDHLERTITEIQRTLADPDHQPPPAQHPHPPLLIAGTGNRIMRLAAEHAAIVGFTGGAPGPAMVLGTSEQLAERVAFVTAAAGERIDEIEKNLIIFTVSDRITDEARGFHALRPEATEAEFLADTPGIQVGSPSEIADRLRYLREKVGISSFTVMEHAMQKFAPVMELLR